MRILKTLLTLTLCLQIEKIYCQYKYDIEYANERIYEKCDDYPDNFVDQIVDMSDLDMQQTENGNLLVKGAITLLKTLPADMPAVSEVFKRERGTWQPTIYTSKRTDLCKAAFDSTELWHPYLKNTPSDQKSCPLTEGQRIDVDIVAESSLNILIRNLEGEYLARLEFGEKSSDMFVCAIVMVNVHKL